MSKTNLGQFLYSERVRRGYESISEYLKNYTNIPISEPYYRDIETGRKKIKIEKAETLCKALKLNKKEFYYHLLGDALPVDVLKDLLKPVATTTFKAASEEFNKLDQKISVIRKAYEEKLKEEPYIVDNEIVKYLDDNFELLSLIHFIYMRKSCSFKELQEIIEKNSIKKPFTKIIDEFEKYGIAIVSHKDKTVIRYRKIFRIPKSNIGSKFKDRFLKDEIYDAIQKINRERVIGPNNTFDYSAIICVKNGDSLNKVSNKLTDFLAELEVEKGTLDEDDAIPFFVSIIFSSREKYNIEKNKGQIKRR